MCVISKGRSQELTSETENGSSGSSPDGRVPDTEREPVVAHDPPGFPQRRQCDVPLHGRHVLPCGRDGAQDGARQEARPGRAERPERDGVVLAEVAQLVGIHVGILVALHCAHLPVPVPVPGLRTLPPVVAFLRSLLARRLCSATSSGEETTMAANVKNLQRNQALRGKQKDRFRAPRSRG
jgi:hypothetical protein